MKQIDLFDKIPDQTPKKRKGRDPFRDRTEKKKKTKTPKFTPPVNVTRVEANPSQGLTTEQVNERLEAGLYNKAPKKYSKTYKSIFIGNICTFFNLLCLLCMLALLFSHAGLEQFTFVLIFLCNISVSISRKSVQNEKSTNSPFYLPLPPWSCETVKSSIFP